MISINKKVIVCFLIFVFSLKASGKEEKFRYTSITIKNDSLLCSFEVNNLFNEDIIEGLKKGMTTVLEFKIQLWNKRSLWIDKLINEDIIRYKINYDVWGQRYIVYKNDQKPRVLDIDGVKELCQNLKHYSLTSLQELQNEKKYIIGIKVTLRPISVENYEEIQRWVIGEAREIDTDVIKKPRKAGEKAGNWILGLLLNLSGFGDKVINARSGSFYLRNNQIIRQEIKKN